MSICLVSCAAQKGAEFGIVTSFPLPGHPVSIAWRRHRLDRDQARPLTPLIIVIFIAAAG